MYYLELVQGLQVQSLCKLMYLSHVVLMPSCSTLKVLSILQNQTPEKSKRNNSCWEKHTIIKKRNHFDSKMIVRHSPVIKSDVMLPPEHSWGQLEDGGRALSRVTVDKGL